MVIGDSDITGSGLTQRDMYSEQLDRQLGLKVYPLAPSDINVFLNSPRFKNDLIKIVILESIERKIAGLPEVRTNDVRAATSKGRRGLNAFLQKNPRLTVLCDRFSKGIMNNYIKTTISRKEENVRLKIKSLCGALLKRPIKKEQTVILMDRNGAFTPEEEIDKIVNKIRMYKTALNKRGIRFIFFPLPNKETIYWNELPLKEKPIF